MFATHRKHTRTHARARTDAHTHTHARSFDGRPARTNDRGRPREPPLRTGVPLVIRTQFVYRARVRCAPCARLCVCVFALCNGARNREVHVCSNVLLAAREARVLDGQCERTRLGSARQHSQEEGTMAAVHLASLSEFGAKLSTFARIFRSSSVSFVSERARKIYEPTRPRGRFQSRCRRGKE